jgi:hypothetical protein
MGYADKANEPPIELAPIVETKQPAQPAAVEPKISADEEAEIEEQARLAEEREKIEKERAEAEKREISALPFTTASFISAYLVWLWHARRTEAFSDQVRRRRCRQ